MIPSLPRSMRSSDAPRASAGLVHATLAGLAGLSLLAGCNSGGGGGGTFEITACAPLGCSSPGGVQIACGVTDIAVNQELRITFSSPVDLSSVNNNSFQVQDASGLTPPGEFLLDVNDPSVLIYRPQLTFDSSGSPVFGLTANESYTIFVPGTASDAGPYIRSQGGALNSKRMFCTVSSSLPVLDLNPGAPTVEILVDVVFQDEQPPAMNGMPPGDGFDDQTGFACAIDQDDDGMVDGTMSPIPAGAASCYVDSASGLTIMRRISAFGAVDVFRTSPIRFEFNDVMNPGTLVNPITGASSFLKVVVDGDGATTTTSDQVPIDGEFTLDIDSQTLMTFVEFTPSLGYPSAGNVPTQPRRIVLTLPATITDLGGNSLANGGLITFVPESVQFPAVEVTEPFANQNNADVTHSGASWGVADSFGGTSLQPGVGGGSGIHGDLNVSAGDTVVLSTDLEDFSGITDDLIYNPATQIRDAVTQVPLSVTGGLFEFANLTVAAGGVVRFEGSNPARIFVRGECRILGTLDVSGSSAAGHLATDCDGGAGGAPGPGGSAGGAGGDRPPTAAFAATTDGDIVVPSAPFPACNPTLYADNDGKQGEGIPIPNTLAPTSSAGGGGGGIAWPQPVGGGTFEFPTGPSDFANQEYDEFFNCRIKAPGSPGGGGAHGLSGFVADLKLPAGFGQVQVPDEALGGDAAAIGITATELTLDPLQGFLRGGAGGGGGGGHLQDSKVNGRLFLDCGVLGDGETPPLRIVEYVASSSAGGGGGGGALQLQAGRLLSVAGSINAAGGEGGSDLVIADPTESPASMPGGGGAGGAVLLQSRTVEVLQTPGRIDLRGGEGGVGSANSRGGAGGPGLLRIESIPALAVSDVAPTDCPSGPLGCLETFFSNSPVLPDPDALQNPFLFPTGSNIDDLFTTGEWQTAASGTGRVSGSMSCWLQPEGNFFVLDFEEDVVDGFGQVTTAAWDLDVQLANVPAPVSFRLPTPQFSGASIEQLVDLSPIPPLFVRFQGARTLQSLESPCDIPLAGPESPIFPGSVSGWVRHPSELNDFFAGDPTKRPNMFRFVVVFDTRDSQVAPFFEGVDDLRVSVVPD